jgi:hypothetical protein
VGADVVRDRLEKVCFAEAGPAVDEERVVGLRRRLGHRERGRVREPVRRADHEPVEGVLAVQPGTGLAPRDLFGDGPVLSPGRLRDRGRRLRIDDRDVNVAFLAERVANRRLDQPAEVGLDPLAREIVRDGEDERVVVQGLAARLTEPGAVGAFVESLLQTTGNVGPQGVRTQLERSLHSVRSAPCPTTPDFEERRS